MNSTAQVVHLCNSKLRQRTDDAERTARRDMRATAHDASDTRGILILAEPDGRLLVESEGRRLHCRRAFSCVIAPEPGDTVLLHDAHAVRPYVLAILERSGERPAARLNVEGDLALEAGRDLRVFAARQLDLHGTGTVRLRGEQLSAVAGQASIQASQAALHAEETSVQSGIVRVIGNVLESVIERMVQVTKTSFRTVQTLDHLRAGHVDHAAEESLRLSGKHVLITGEHLSKIDANQIHLG